MSLLRCEWKRLFARRLTRVMVAIVLVFMVIITGATAASTHRINDADRALAAQIAQDQQEGLRQCQDAENSGEMQLPPGETCESQFSQTLNADYFLPQPWTFATDAPNAILIFAGLFAMFTFLVGASFIGAEWTSGGVMNLLLWRPRRRRVLAAKLTALGTGTAAIGVVLAGIWTGLLCAIASTRGVYGHVTNGLLQSLGLDFARALALGVAVGLIGFAVASLGRHTSAALGVVVGYAVIWELGFRLVTASVPSSVERPERFLLSKYVVAWLRKGYKIDRYVCPPSGECVDHVWKMTMTSAAEVGAIVIGVIMAWAFWSIRRRDVA